MKWEFPRLCRGGSQTLRIPGVYLPLLPSFCRSPLPREPRAVAVASAFQRLRSGPFEGPATVKPPALPEDTYSTCPRNPSAISDAPIVEVRRRALCCGRVRYSGLNEAAFVCGGRYGISIDSWVGH